MKRDHILTLALYTVYHIFTRTILHAPNCRTLFTDYFSLGSIINILENYSFNIVFILSYE